MATLSVAGIEPTSLDGYVGRIEEVLRNALGQDLNLAAETPQGQLAGLLGIALAEIDEALVHVAAGLNLDQAAGRQLDDWGTLLRVARIAGEHSTVTATLSGLPSTLVPAGSRARTTAGTLFASDEAVRIEAGGTVDVLMRAVDPGPLLAPAGTLTGIVDVISGWTGVTNAAAAQVGRDTETDAEYRRRYVGETAVHARESLDALSARLLDVSGVTAAAVHDNPTASAVTVQAVDIAAHSVLAIVSGGADQDVAGAIRDAKPLGIPTVGDVQVDVDGTTIRFRRVREVPIRVQVTTTIGAGFPADGIPRIRQRIVDWVSGAWTSGEGDFEVGGLAIGASLDPIRLYSPISSVPGHTVASVVVTDTSDQDLPAVIDLDERLTASLDEVTVGVS